MKPLILILITLCFTFSVIAQKDFHGEIIYKLNFSGEAQPGAELKVLFGDRKLKLMFKEKEKYKHEAFLVFLDSGVTYSIDIENKMFSRKMLSANKPLLATEKKSINGYSTTLFQPENNGLGNLGNLIGASNTVFYLADSLTYFVPEKYRGNVQLVMIQANKIVLGTEIQITDTYANEEDSSFSKREKLITAEAISIKPMQVDESEFIIPKDLVDKKTIVAVDSVMASVDTPVAVKPNKPVKKKAPVKNNKPKPELKPKTAAKKE